MNSFDNATIITTLLGKLPWTIALSLIAFGGGAILAGLLTASTVLGGKVINLAVSAVTVSIQSMPLLMVIFLCFFGLPLMRVDVSPWFASSLALIAFSTAFLTEIWRAAVRAVPVGQWEAASSSGLTRLQSLRHVIVPQAMEIALPPSVGFSMQVVKATALTSIVGFVEVTRAGYVLNNITFRPFFVFSIVGLIYIAINLPLSITSRKLERRVSRT